MRRIRSARGGKQFNVVGSWRTWSAALGALAGAIVRERKEHPGQYETIRDWFGKHSLVSTPEPGGIARARMDGK